MNRYFGFILGAISLGILISVLITLFSQLEQAKGDRERCMEVATMCHKFVTR